MQLLCDRQLAAVRRAGLNAGMRPSGLSDEVIGVDASATRTVQTGDDGDGDYHAEALHRLQATAAQRLQILRQAMGLQQQETARLLAHLDTTRRRR